MGMTNKAATRMQGALDQAIDAAAPAAQWIEDHGQEITANGEKVVARTRHYVTGHPLAALGLALAAGFLISRLIR
jgi:ElaB/YqjD/DUF883 family membrane-anchored ribosome-binding protein